MNVKNQTEIFAAMRDRIISLPDRQLRFECSLRAERLVDQLNPDELYSLCEIARSIVGGPIEFPAAPQMLGGELRQALLNLIKDLAADSIIPADAAPEPVLSIDEVAQKWRVSTKTIRRWRDRELIARKFLVDGRPRVGFLESSLRRFAAANPRIVRRGSRFSRISEDERQQTVRRADAMFHRGATFAEVVSTLATDMQRSPDSIRKILFRAGRTQPIAGELTDQAQQRLYAEYCRGKSIKLVAQQFNISEAATKEFVDRLRMARVFELPLDFMPSPEFTKRSAEKRILAATPADTTKPRMPRKPANLPAYIASLYDVPLLTAAQEKHLFRKYNYVKFKASQLRDGLNHDRPDEKKLDEIERLYKIAVETKNILVRSNMRLVVAVAKKYISATSDLFEKVSEGNVSLMRAVEKFDYTRGFKFSTYATWAIKKNFIRAYSTEIKQADRFRTGHEEVLDARPAYRSDPHRQLAEQRRREEQVSSMMRHLTERERQIISSRFGIGAGKEPMTLKDVGRIFGVSKERIRQIEARAMGKLREAATSAPLELPAVPEPHAYREN